MQHNEVDTAVSDRSGGLGRRECGPLKQRAYRQGAWRLQPHQNLPLAAKRTVPLPATTPSVQ